MSLRDTTEMILYDTSRTARWVQAADYYIRQYNTDREHFVLPKAFAALAPVIEEYADNFGGFVQYVQGIRDSLPPKSQASKDAQVVYRKVVVRYVQQQRRERVDRAMKKAQELYGDAPFQTRLAWMAKLEHVWAKRRLEYLARKKMSREERAEALEEFWDMIDEEIEAGERIPRWE